VLISGDGDLDTAHRLLPPRPGAHGRRPRRLWHDTSIDRRDEKVGSTPQGPDHADETPGRHRLAALGSGDFEETYPQVGAEDSERGSGRARRSRTHASTPGEGGL